MKTLANIIQHTHQNLVYKLLKFISDLEQNTKSIRKTHKTLH